jgi:hypothetical protein
VICLLSKHWEASHECRTEFRYAENLNKTILVARLEAVDLANADAVQVGSRAGQDAYADFDTPVKAAGRLSLALRYTRGSIE